MGTPRFWTVLLLAIAVALINSWQPLDLALGAAIFLMVLAGLWSRQSLSGIKLDRTLSRDQAQAGQTIVDEITVYNQAKLPRLWVEIRDHSTLPTHRASRVVHLAGGESHRWTIETLCARRGRFHLGPVTLRSGDPFGLFPRVRTWSQTIDMIVFPPQFPLLHFAVPEGTLTGAAMRERRTPFVTPSVASVRDYVSGDSFNRISWTSSARFGKLMVKEFDSDPTSDVWIVLDLDRRYRAQAWQAAAPDPTAIYDPMVWMDGSDDYAAAAAASISQYCLDEGRGVGLIASGSHYGVIPAERSPRTQSRMLETLAVVQADGSLPLPELLVAEWRRFSRNAGIVLITSSTDVSWIEAIAHLQARRVHVVVVFVDPASFHGETTDTPVLDGLASSGVPTYLLRYGTNIGLSLREPR